MEICNCKSKGGCANCDVIFEGGVNYLWRNVTRGGGGKFLPKIVWRHLWTAPKGPHECEGVRLQVLRFVVNALVLGYISLVSIRMLENEGVHAFWFISGFVWLLCVCVVTQSFLYENCVNIWRSLSVICAGDCCALLKGFRILFWAHVSGKQSCVSIWKVHSVRWCRLNADWGDWLCDRQVVGLDGICKLQHQWTPSCVMAQMWRDRM